MQVFYENLHVERFVFQVNNYRCLKSLDKVQVYKFLLPLHLFLWYAAIIGKFGVVYRARLGPRGKFSHVVAVKTLKGQVQEQNP